MTLEQACPPEYQWAQCAFKDSMTHGNSAIRITYRISLRSSSMPEPRDPLLKVLFFDFWSIIFRRHGLGQEFVVGPSADALQGRNPRRSKDRSAEATTRNGKQRVGRSGSASEP